MLTLKKKKLLYYNVFPKITNILNHGPVGRHILIGSIGMVALAIIFIILICAAFVCWGKGCCKKGSDKKTETIILPVVPPKTGESMPLFQESRG